MAEKLQFGYVGVRDAHRSRQEAFRRGTDINIIDTAVDDVWAGIQNDTAAPKPYFDYFYSGEDIRVYLAELGDDPEFGDIPIHNLAFSVQQQKQPLYGHNNYTYNTMLRGTRIISGQFTLVTKYPGYMKLLLAAAAKKRADGIRRDAYPNPDAWREDYENLEKYWHRNLDVSVTEENITEWSVHPPFTLIVAYGIQNASLNPSDLSSYYEPYSDDQLLLQDVGERLIEDPNVNTPSRIYLDGCELTGVQHTYAPNMMVAEMYTFLARDIFVPSSAWRVSRTNRAVTRLPNGRRSGV